MIVWLIFIVWIGSAPFSLRLAKRKEYANPLWRGAAMFGGPFALIFFALAEPPSLDPDTGLEWPRKNRKALNVTGAAFVGAIVFMSAMTPHRTPAQECYRKYGYDEKQQLACLIVVDLEQRQQLENARASAWRASH